MMQKGGAGKMKVVLPGAEREFLEKMYRKLLQRNGTYSDFCS